MAPGFLLGLPRTLEVQRVVYRNCDLTGDLTEQLLMFFRERVLAKTRHSQHAELAAMHDERDTAARFDAEFGKPFVEIRDGVFRAGAIDEDRLAGSERLSPQAAFEWDRGPLGDDELLVGKIVRVGSQLIGVGVVKR